jgi:beta-lactamase regulating signal transducer with metallopeptidase domain/Mg-chelatase subunit ChlD
MGIDLVSQLSSAAIRACALGLIAFGVLFLFRVRSSAARHATWTVGVLGMLLQIVLGPAVPGVRLKVLPAAPVSRQLATAKSPPASFAPRALAPASDRSAPPGRWISSSGILAVVYFGVAMLLFARIALGLWGLRRILRHAKPLPELGPCFFESESFVIPASAGCFRPRILLPRGWRGWDAITLKAVIAHEAAHSRRKDWLICLVSHVNVCIFWFHPLAWWMDRELATLAEEACDDIALAEIEDRDKYGATLVAFARATAAVGTRLHWGAISMARESNVARRLNRIMNTRLPAARPFGRMAWVLLLTCGLPMIYLSAAVELAPRTRPPSRLEAAAASLPPESPPRTLIAQAAPNQPRPSPPPAVPSRRDNAPVSMCILIDNSGSMYEKKNQAKAAALALVSAAKPGDELCIVEFNDEAWLSADLTADLNKVRDALSRIEARGGSALRDAINLSVDLIQEKAHNRKVLVLITDGDDTSSAVSEEQVRDKIKNSGVVVYSIGLHERDAGKDFEATRTLRQLAALNGGSYFDPEGSADVESIASQIERDARNK